MSAKWMRVETDFVDHPKVRALASILDVTRGDAGWVILRAWSWMSRFCPTGQVVGQPTGQVVGHLKMSLAEAAGQHLDKPIGTEELLSALVSAGLFEESADGSISGHDWAEHQGKVAATAEKERERKRAYRAKASGNVPGTSRGTSDGTKTGRPAQRDVTGRDVTGRIKETSVELSSTAPLALVGEVSSDPKPNLEAKLTDDEFQVFEHWRVSCRHPRAQPTPERKRLIAKWLPIYGVDGLQRAIDGCAHSAWHQGENDRHKRFDDIELILRDAKHIEGFMQGTAERAS